MKSSTLITAAFIAVLGSAVVHAKCDPTARAYMNHEDDVGVSIDLSYECGLIVRTGDVCLYLKDEVAIISGHAGGKALPSNDLYRTAVKDNKNSLKVSVQTGIRDSMIVYEYVKINYDKKKNKGTIDWGSRGVNPIAGYLVEKESAALKCSKFSVKK